MLTLSLFRHAKSSRADPRLEDFERPLNERGEAAAPRMGAFMARHGLTPDLILCSPALRTRQTLDLVRPHLPGKPKVAYEDALYLATPSALLNRVRKAPAKASHVMVIGHDPGLHILAQELAASGKRAELKALAEKFPTAALAVITFAARSWTGVKRGAGRLQLFMVPKHLP
jgi:phosphohistidine phosphatase